jgi:hypothetical protein
MIYIPQVSTIHSKFWYGMIFMANALAHQKCGWNSRKDSLHENVSGIFLGSFFLQSYKVCPHIITVEIVPWEEMISVPVKHYPIATNRISRWRSDIRDLRLLFGASSQIARASQWLFWWYLNLPDSISQRSISAVWKCPLCSLGIYNDKKIKV